MNITLCIPTYNRNEMVINSFSEIIDDKRINEIVIMDDCSDIEIYNSMCLNLKKLNDGRIKVYRNDINKRAFMNKLSSVEKSTNDWIILLDSDNKLTKNYIDSIPNNLEDNVFYIPSHAICDSPYLNYQKHSDKFFDINDYKKISHSDEIMLNTGNYLFNKKTYIESIRKEGNNLIDSYAVDAFYQIFLCYKNIEGFKLKVVDGMKYYHHLHQPNGNECGSYYVQNSKKSTEVVNMIKNIINKW